MSDVERRMEVLEQRVGHVEVELQALKNTLQEIKKDTAELVDLLKGARVFAKVLSWFVGISAGIGTIYAMWWKK